jgi:hypothetical protein
MEKRTYIVGDTDGGFAGLKTRLLLLGAIKETGEWVGKDNSLVLLGDHMGDRRTEDERVIPFLMRLRDEVQRAGGEFIRLDGNHEGALHSALCAKLRIPGYKTSFFTPGTMPNRNRNYRGVYRWPLLAGMRGAPQAPEDEEAFLKEKGRLKKTLLLLRSNRPDLLSFLTEGQLVHRVPISENKWAYMTHTPVTAGMGRVLMSGGLVGINRCYQAGLRHHLKGAPLEAAEEEAFSKLRDTFLVSSSRTPLGTEALRETGLASQGAKIFICGHTYMLPDSIDNTEFVSVNRSAAVLLSSGDLRVGADAYHPS